MRFLGLEITRAKALTGITSSYGGLWSGFGGWWPVVREPFTGAWQRNCELRVEDVTAYYAVFACITLISSDVAKLGVKIIRFKDNVWQESSSPAYDAVLARPNQYQNYIQFFENWILSKLLRGNTYVLKSRDQRNVVNQLYVLDPARVRVLVSSGGSIFYQLMEDNLADLTRFESVDLERGAVVPASEIIHDRMNCFFHPLCGIPPLYAATLPARQGLSIQHNSTEFFDNRAIPGGILTAPGRIPEQSVESLKSQWEQNFGGHNRGKTAVLGDGMKFEPMAVTASDAQLLEQAKATAEWVCSCFHVPPYKIGVGPMPSYNNVQALNIEYYSQCLQSLIEAAEVCLDQGLELKANMGVKFDTDALLRMDTVSQISSLKEGTLAGIYAPNESRAKLGLPPVEGGASPYLQQQNYSLAALNKRDSQDDPFKPASAPAPAQPAAETPPGGQGNENQTTPEQRAAAISAGADKLARFARRFAA